MHACCKCTRTNCVSTCRDSQTHTDTHIDCALMWADSGISVMYHIKANRSFTINIIPPQRKPEAESRGFGLRGTGPVAKCLLHCLPWHLQIYTLFFLCEVGNRGDGAREGKITTWRGRKVKWVEWFQTGKRHIRYSLSFPSWSFSFLFLPPSLSLLAWRRIVGGERSCLVKRLADDRKIRGTSLLTGCCAHPLFFCFKCFLSVCFQSGCLSSTMSATCAHMY